MSYFLGGLCLAHCCYALIRTSGFPAYSGPNADSHDSVGLTGVTVFWDMRHTYCTIGVSPHARAALLFFYIFSELCPHERPAAEAYPSTSNNLGPRHINYDRPWNPEERAPERPAVVECSIYTERRLRGYHDCNLCTHGRK